MAKKKNSIENSSLSAGRDINNGDINNTYNFSAQSSEKSEFSVDKIKKEFANASLMLGEYPNHLEGILDSHIERKETIELYNWVKIKSDNQKSIAMIKGEPGIGKSVILKDLYQKLFRDETAVLGIKADRYYVENIRALETQINLGDTLEKMVYKLRDKKQEVVIIIDQIDALSLALSSKREYLTAYRHLVRRLSSIYGVKIILSVRTWDLEYDKELNFLKQDKNNDTKINQKLITVNKLSDEDVSLVLKKLNFPQNQISDKLLSLLKTPLHLNVFSKVCKNASKNEYYTLKDLYQELWYQKVIGINSKTKAKKKKCIDFLYKLVSDVKINISILPYREKYSKEINYLKSEGIIVEKGDNVQFFHQSFFDFVFAKSFVEKNQSIHKLLKKHQQGLLVRTKLKMILAYLRETNHKEYILIIKSLLFQKKGIRFHIKLLLLNILGYENNPTPKEFKLINKFILKDKLLKRPFLESAWGDDWLSFFTKKSILKDLVLLKDEKNKNSQEDKQLWFHFLARKLPVARNEVLDYLYNLEEFDRKPNFTYLILHSLKKWDNHKAKKIFEQYQKFIEKQGGYQGILEDAANYDLDWVLKKYNLYIQSLLNDVSTSSLNIQFNLNYSDKHLMNVLFEKNISVAFNFYLRIVKKLISKTKSGPSNRLYSDLAFWGVKTNNYHRVHEYEEIYDKLKQIIRAESLKGSNLFKEFEQKHQSSNSITLLQLLSEGYKENPTNYVENIFSFIIKLHKKGCFKNEGTLQYLIRKLLHKTYSLFSKVQKHEINNILLSIKSKYEQGKYTDTSGKEKPIKASGALQYKFIACIPEEERNNNLTLKNRHAELERKFGKHEDKNPNRFTMSGVSAPLTQQAYDKMSLVQWEKSFKKYDNDYPRGFETNKGSLLEHSRAFEAEVSKRPNFFYPLIQKIISKNNVHQSYIVKGLEGLKKCNYDLIKTLKLYELAIQLEFDREHTLYLIWITDFFIGKRNISQPVVDFLIDNALNHPDPKDDIIPHFDTINSNQDPIQDGINTVRGAAAKRLSFLFFLEDQEKKIFKTLFKIAKDKSIKVKSCILHQLDRLTLLNEKKALKLFIKIAKTDEEAILRHLFYPAQFFSHKYFAKLIPFLKRSIKHNSLKRNAAVIVSKNWIKGEDKAWIMLKAILKTSEDARFEMPAIALLNIYSNDGKINPRSEKLFKWNFKDTSDKVQRGYESGFHRLTVEDFPHIFHLLEEYAESNAVKQNHRKYFSYLLKCVRLYPKECIELMVSFDGYKPNKNIGYWHAKPIEVIMSAYNQLDSSKKEDRKYIDTAMKIFDKMLLNQQLRNQANKVIENLE